MSKTAAFILNHNLPEQTDKLYLSLKPYERDDYDLMILDNGSSNDGKSKYTTHLMPENLFFGGGFNAAMQHVIKKDQYDSMLFLNNDLTVYPYNFVRSLRKEMFWINGDVAFDIVSPTVYDIEGEVVFKTMHVWGSPFVREVPYVDFQSPLISKRLLMEVKEIDPDLIFGWGVCFLFALTCKEKGWKIGASDVNTVMHYGCMTTKKNAVANLSLEEYPKLAEIGQDKFFAKINKIKEMEDIKISALNYSFP